MTFFLNPARLAQMRKTPHNATCLGLGHTFFCRNPTFSEVFEQNNVGVIGNVFMQYFLSVLLYSDIGEKKLKLKFCTIKVMCLMDADTSDVISSL